MAKRITALQVFKSIYYNEFQWSLLKSFGMFFLGVRIAKSFAGVEIMPAIPVGRP